MPLTQNDVCLCDVYCGNHLMKATNMLKATLNQTKVTNKWIEVDNVGLWLSAILGFECHSGSAGVSNVTFSFVKVC